MKNNVVNFRMTKTETEKDILALRYPIDVDVTDDIARKRSVVEFFQDFLLQTSN